MNLRDTNLRYAALKLIADAVKDAMEREKADHLRALQESAEDSGSTKWEVTVDGGKVASLSLSTGRGGGPKITDEAALVAAIEQVHPEMVETRLKPWASKQLLDSIVDVTEDGAVTRDGELLPGIEQMPGGSPYQSLVWAKDKGDARGDELGRRMVAEAIQSGALRDLLSDTGLPLIGPGA